MPKVYIINKSAHNFNGAKKYGSPVFLSEGLMDRYATTHIHRQFSDFLSNSKPEDYIVLCSLNVMNAIACSIFAKKHGTLNLLLYKRGSYVERNLMI